MGDVGNLAGRWSQRWGRLMEWMALPVIFADTGKCLYEKYSEPGRFYHSAGHILYCLDQLDNYPSGTGDSDALELAIWYHDAVYDPRVSDGTNERLSARFFNREFGDLTGSYVNGEAVGELIMATAHQGVTTGRGGDLIADIDLSILSDEEPRYDQYASDVRRDYGHLDDGTWNLGRAAVLRKFLSRDYIYKTRHYRKLYEERARANLLRELELLVGERGSK